MMTWLQDFVNLSSQKSLILKVEDNGTSEFPGAPPVWPFGEMPWLSLHSVAFNSGLLSDASEKTLYDATGVAVKSKTANMLAEKINEEIENKLLYEKGEYTIGIDGSTLSEFLVKPSSEIDGTKLPTLSFPKITDEQIASLSASKLIGQLVGTQIAPGSLNSEHFAHIDLPEQSETELGFGQLKSWQKLCTSKEDAEWGDVVLEPETGTLTVCAGQDTFIGLPPASALWDCVGKIAKLEDQHYGWKQEPVSSQGVTPDTGSVLQVATLLKQLGFVCEIIETDIHAGEIPKISLTMSVMPNKAHLITSFQTALVGSI